MFKLKTEYFIKFQFLLICTVFVAAMNYVDINVGGSGVQLPYNIATWAIIALFVLSSGFYILLSGQVIVSKVYLCYLLGVGLLVLPLTFNDTLLLDTEYLVFVGLAAGLIFLFSLYQIRSISFKKYLLLLLLISSVIQTFWGLIQYYLITEIGPLFWRAQYGIPYGVFQQVNDFSSYLIVGSMISIYYLFTQPKYKKPLLWGTAILLLCNHHLMVLAGVTTAKVLSIICVLFYLTYWAIKSKTYRRVVILTSVVIVATLIPREAFYTRPLERIQQGEIIQDESGDAPVIASEAVTASDGDIEKPVAKKSNIVYSAQGEDSFWNKLGTRKTLYPLVLEMIMDEPWTGHGIGSFKRKYLEYQGEYIIENPNQPAEFYLDHAHNEVLHWMVELGVFALLGFLAIAVTWWYFSRRKSLDVNILLIALPLVLHSMFELPLYHSAPHFLVFLSILYLADNSDKKIKKVPRVTGFLAVPGFLAVFLYVQTFLFSTAYAGLMFFNYYDIGKKDLSGLLSISNPAAFRERYNFEFMQAIMIRANLSKELSVENAKKYIYWAYSVIQYAPQEPIYENFIAVLKIYGNPETALKYAKEAHFLYPFNEKFPQQVAELEVLLQEKPQPVEINGSTDG